MDSEPTGLSVVCIWIVARCVRYTVSSNFTNSLSFISLCVQNDGGYRGVPYVCRMMGLSWCSLCVQNDGVTVVFLRCAE